MTCHDMSWHVMTCHDMSWHLRKVMIFYEKSWFFTKSHDFLWKFKIFLRKVMISFEKSRFLTKSHDFFTKSHDFLRKVDRLPLGRGIGHRAPVWWGSAFDPAARRSTPPRISSQVLFIWSPRARAEGHAAETTTTTTRWRRAGVPCHHRAQGTLVNPFGYPPLSDICL